MSTRRGERILHSRQDAARKGIALPIAEVATVILVVELCEVSRTIDREECMCHSVGGEAPVTNCIIAEEVFREDGSERGRRKRRVEAEHLINLVLDCGEQAELTRSAWTANVRDVRIQTDRAITKSAAPRHNRRARQTHSSKVGALHVYGSTAIHGVGRAIWKMGVGSCVVTARRIGFQCSKVIGIGHVIKAGGALAKPG